MLNGTQILLLGVISFVIYFLLIQKNRNRIGKKYTRKLVHVANGLTAGSVTFIARPSAYWGASAAAIVTTGLLITLRMLSRKKENYGSAMYTTSKYDSIGEILFPIVFIILAPLTRLDFTTYFLPVMILTLSDTAAALIGANIKSLVLSEEGEGMKTLAGTLSFFVVTIVILGEGFLATGVNITWIVFGKILFMSGCLAITELTSTHGTDNFLVPITAYLLLETQGNWKLSYMIGMGFLVVVLILVYCIPRRTKLTGVQILNLWLFSCLSGNVELGTMFLVIWLLYIFCERKEKLTVNKTCWFQNGVVLLCLMEHVLIG